MNVAHERLRSCAPRRPFVTVGIEGAGHHLIEAMSTTLCDGGAASTARAEPCGGQYSFPYGMSWRRQDTASLPTMGPRGGRPWPSTKYLVLLREPAAALSSALARFWSCRGPDTLERELWAAREALRAMHRFVGALAAHNCTLVLSYERLVSQPWLHVRPLAAFLGVPESDGALRAYLGSAIARGRAAATETALNARLVECLRGAQPAQRGREGAEIYALCGALAARAECSAGVAPPTNRSGPLGCVREFQRAWGAYVMGERFSNALP